MEASSQSSNGRGLWNQPRVTQYSKETQDMLRLMMQESRFTNLHRKQVNECLKNGTALPLTSDPTSSASLPRAKTSKSVQKRLPSKPQRRSAESCRSGDSYVRDKFHPRPLRDLEKEKQRLQSIMATGEEPTPPSSHNPCPTPEVVEQKDRYQEVLDEIEERRQFLEDMSSLGQEKQYVNIINTEISQRIRDLQALDKARREEERRADNRKDGAERRLAATD